MTTGSGRVFPKVWDVCAHGNLIETFRIHADIFVMLAC